MNLFSEYNRRLIYERQEYDSAVEHRQTRQTETDKGEANATATEHRCHLASFCCVRGGGDRQNRHGDRQYMRGDGL